MQHIEEKQDSSIGPAANEVAAALGRVLASPQFSTARRLSSFLDFIVRNTLAGSPLKESLIGVEVYGREPGYDPKTDSIVRAEAVRLRAKLREYYENDGRLDPVVIELPKGTYQPSFRLAEKASPPPSRPPRRWAWWVIAAALALTTGGTYYAATRNPPATIAVMPLTIVGPADSLTPLTTSMTAHLTQALLTSGSWNVVAPAPPLDLAADPPPLERLRRGTPAQVILTGHFRMIGLQDARLTLHLVNAGDGYLLWQATQVRPILAWTEGQRHLAHALVVSLSQRRAGHVAPLPAYLRAREAWSTFTAGGLEQSVPLFKEAIAAQPKLAAAWAGLADAQSRLADDAPEADTQARVEAARQAAIRAITLDETNAEAHAALGRIYLYRDRSYRQAAAHLQRAVALDPSRLWPVRSYAQALAITGDLQSALAVVRDARSRLPSLPDLVMQEGSIYFIARRYEKMEAAGRELLRLEPESSLGLWLVGLSLELRGRIPEAIGHYLRAVEKSPRLEGRIQCALSHALGRAGDRAGALEVLKRILPDPQATPNRLTLAYCAALTYTSLGQRDQAFAWLETSRRIPDTSFPYFPLDPRFDPLKDDPRYVELSRAARGVSPAP